MIHRLARALHDAGLPVAFEDLFAIAWLALAMPPPAATSASPKGGADAPAPPPAPGPPLPPPPPPPATPPAGPTGQTTTLYASSQQGRIRAGVLRVPGVLQAPPAPQLRRALQPFARRVPSATRRQLDEEATAERRADTRVWELRYRPLRERWFDLHVVVDRGAGMDLWQGEVEALLRGLKSQGGFRSLQRWVLGGTTAAALARRADTPPLPLAALHPPGQRPLVLVLTDGSAERWHTGAAQRWLWTAAERAPLALLQLMPPHAWRHTPLGEPLALGWWPRAGLPASALQLAGGDLDEALEGGWRAVPLVALDPPAIQRWALAATARGGATVPVALVGAAHAALRRARTEPDAAERVARFRHKASAAAFDLAVFLSVPDPLTLPVMRLVQRTMLPASGTAELAEFFNGGLLEPLPGPQTAWRLRPGVREALRGALRLSEERHIVEQLRRVGQALEDAAADAPRFEAWFPSAAGGATLSDWALPFAEASREVLRGVQPREAVGIAWRPCLAVSPDGGRIAVGSADGRIHFWNAAPVQPTGVEIQAHRSAVQRLAWTPDGRLLASAAADGEVRLHDADGHPAATLVGGQADPVALAISPDGLLLAVGTAAGHVRVWDLAALGATVAEGPLNDGAPLHDLCFVAGAQLAVLRHGGAIDVWQPGAPERRIERRAADPSSRQLLVADGALFVAGPARLQRLEVALPVTVAEAELAPEPALLSIAAEGADALASLEAGATVRFWRRRDLQRIDATVQLEPDAVALASAPDGALFALTFGGQLLPVPRPHRGRTKASHDFLSRVDVLQAVHDSGRLPEGEAVLDALLIFTTDTQQSWMVFARRSLVLLLDDADTRRSRRLVQQVLPYERAVPVSALIDRKGVATVGFAKASQRWYYSTALFATPELLEEAVASRAAEVQQEQLALQHERLSIVTITGPDGRTVACGYWLADDQVATSYSALAGDGPDDRRGDWRAGWQVQVPGREGTLPARVEDWDEVADAALLRVDTPFSVPLPGRLQAPTSSGRWHAVTSRDDTLIGGEYDDGGGAAPLSLREGLPALAGPLAPHWRGAPVWASGSVLGHLTRRDASSAVLSGCSVRAVVALQDRLRRRRWVYVSSSHHDGSWAERLARTVRDAGCELVPNASLAAGEGWGEISEAIASCGLGIVVCTPAWAASAFVQRELEVLLQRQRLDSSFGILVLAPPGAPVHPALADAPTLRLAGPDLLPNESEVLQLLVRAWTDDHGRVEAAQRLVRTGEFELVPKVLQPLAASSEVVRLRAHALRRMDRLREALATVEPWLADHADDGNVLLERALILRAVWRHSPLDPSSARQAAQDFERVWELQPAPWLAVSAAALWLPLGDHARSRQFAQAAVGRVKSIPEPGLQGDPYLPSTMAEAFVLLGRFDEARQWWRHSAGQPGLDLQPAAAAIRADLQALGADASLLDDVLPPARVIAVVGLPAEAATHRFERPGRTASAMAEVQRSLERLSLVAPGTATVVALVDFESLAALQAAALRRERLDLGAAMPIDPAELAQRWRHDEEAARLALWAAGDGRIRRLATAPAHDARRGGPTPVQTTAALEAVRQHARERADAAHVRPQLLLFWHAPGGPDAARQAAAAWHEDGFSIEVVDLFERAASA